MQRAVERELTKEDMMDMKMDLLRGVVETIYLNMDEPDKEKEKRLKQAFDIRDLDTWPREKCVAFALPFKPSMRKPVNTYTPSSQTGGGVSVE